MKLKTRLIFVAVCCASAAFVSMAAETPFAVSAKLLPVEASGQRSVEVTAKVSPGAYLYAEAWKVTAADGAELRKVQAPSPKFKKDPFTGDEVSVYVGESRFVYALGANVAFPLELSVDYQGCDSTSCFMPQTQTFQLSPNGASPPADEDVVDSQLEGEAGGKTMPPPSKEQPWFERLNSFSVVSRSSGYMPSGEFNDFLRDALRSKGADLGEDSDFAGKGMALTIILIFLGGLALNLTPCVLPMIPITLAVIGAGAHSKSGGAKGVVLGCLYGGAAALVYGGLGIVVILTGSRFGALNASPWFNYAVAVVFVLLGLAMFDVIMIDFSRFQAKAGPAKNTGSYLSVFVMGIVSALLAGACVAPVVISVMVLSMGLYAKGNVFALALPLLLGAGMASPWPFLGAGVSLFPKPGAWMTRVKQVFGVLILLFAVYYGYLGVELQFSHSAGGVVGEGKNDSAWLTSFPEGMTLASREGKPIFVDFYADWCKNCQTMDLTTFRNPSTIEALKPFVKLKFDATDMKDPDVKRVLDHFKILGLPTYLVLKHHSTSE